MGPLQSVLICGWADSKWMVDLLRALDVELPRGSEVVLLNMRDTQRVMGAPLGGGGALPC